ncbi:MAG: GerMN domain-containing protein, partial [Bifidobacteriaceae bacterium]|nr:GerMN domain-containing protein [Bifidobacteriaceae bacterium]
MSGDLGAAARERRPGRGAGVRAWPQRGSAGGLGAAGRHRRLVGGAGLAAAVTLAALAGCGDLPRSGSVHAGREDAAVEQRYIQAAAAGPAAGASPDQIVEGFLQAMMAGATDDFKVARSYLADEIAGTWDPSAQVTVYQSGEAPVVAESATQAGRITLTVTQVGRVDEVGRYGVLAPTSRSETLELTENDSAEWRIAELPDGTVIPEDVFRGDYVAAPLYFPSANAQYLVPDRRVFPRQSAATEAAKQFLAGPPAYLTGAVGSVVPAGTRLATDAVKVTDSVATVNLTSPMARASETARATVLACLTETLTQLPDVRSVALEVEGAPLAVTASAGLTANPPALAGPFYLGDGGVWRYENGTATPIGATEAASSWESFAVDHTGQRFAGLRDGHVEVLAGGELMVWELID